MPQLRANKKAAAGRTQLPPKPSPAAAPGTPGSSVPTVLYPGTFSSETAAERMAGKRQVAGPTILKTAEASASDASQIIAIKQEAATEMAASQTQASTRPCSEGGIQWKDPRMTLKIMHEGTQEWYKHMSGLQTTLDEELEVRYSIVAAPGHFGG